MVDFYFDIKSIFPVYEFICNETNKWILQITKSHSEIMKKVGVFVRDDPRKTKC